MDPPPIWIEYLHSGGTRALTFMAWDVQMPQGMTVLPELKRHLIIAATYLPLCHQADLFSMSWSPSNSHGQMPSLVNEQ